MGTALDTIRVTVEQAIHYSSLMADSGFAYGFQVTDTIFANGVSNICSLAQSSAQGDIARQLYDTLHIRSPYVRFKVKNLKTATTNLMYLYIRRQIPDAWIQGAAGRLMKPVRQ